MANNGMTMEGDKVYNDKVRKQNLAIGEKNSLRGSAMQNIGTGINEMGAVGNLYDQSRNGENNDGANMYKAPKVPMWNQQTNG